MCSYRLSYVTSFAYIFEIKYVHKDKAIFDPDFFSSTGGRADLRVKIVVGRYQV